jgi:hypothetical protein
VLLANEVRERLATLGEGWFLEDGQAAEAIRAWQEHPRFGDLADGFAEWVEREARVMGVVRAPGPWLRSAVGRFLERKDAAPAPGDSGDGGRRTWDPKRAT